MIVAVDVDYRQDAVVAACVGFETWQDETAVLETTQIFPPNAESYEPGQFYKREMPYLEALIGALPRRPDAIVIDGYVWLDAGRPGLGAHLHEALHQRIPVVGVAKRSFRDATAIEISRGTSNTPLYVTAVGIDSADAARNIAAMHGPHRLPTLLKRVDRLSRESV